VHVYRNEDNDASLHDREQCPCDCRLTLEQNDRCTESHIINNTCRPTQIMNCDAIEYAAG
jgi:hypothetical protein